ncbi:MULTISPECIES: isoprenoid biosynthesis glyoxalase ElbB [unclassified Lentimicrobium]|uniref:isoprenoid biosynthesis glyoxalase ElbB n=1 Tax=unclassified Lentimicrobium TaxID=2677434 RepID=UPI001554D722|nr:MULTISPECIES: isoprenoid biosynthesis glyoxalase ElbB [unclassified Lentimicrobium]NPD47385.1 isoprenoid biosynthesis glyoxalase ElbB [Lentimicrobium sp. S6]NPD86684.1 isoprenoid biosynthesis glyoxalase ElbB [Lentimicrobium sp. L6]
MKKFAIILSGCGVFDGAEIHEATLSMLAVMMHGGVYEIFAPDIKQHHVINHITGEEMDEERNVLIESARIARGKISPMSAFQAEEFDALLIPGGFGAAKNLSDFAFKGAEAGVFIQVKDAIQEMHRMGKPIGALCISPALIALTLDNVDLTIGNDKATIEALEALNAHHLETSHGEVVHDKAENIFTTPCYMLDATILEIAIGAENIVKAMMESME